MLEFDQGGSAKFEKGDDLIHLFKIQKTKLFPLCARGHVPRLTHDVQRRPRSLIHARCGEVVGKGMQFKHSLYSINSP